MAIRVIHGVDVSPLNHRELHNFLGLVEMKAGQFGRMHERPQALILAAKDLAPHWGLNAI